MISDQANVTVENKTLANISVVWVNKQSIEEVLLPVVEAGKSYVISSSTGHELRAREAVSHRLLRSFMVTAEPAQLMTIEYPSAVKEEAKAAAAPKQEESDEVKEQKRMAQESDAVGVTSTEVFAKYQPSHAQPGCAHPADVAEAASLAATPAPHCPYPLIDSMPPELISQGKLSSLQFESVALCCQRHLHVLPAPPTATAAAAGSPAGGGRRAAASSSAMGRAWARDANLQRSASTRSRAGATATCGSRRAPTCASTRSATCATSAATWRCTTGAPGWTRAARASGRPRSCRRACSSRRT